LLRDLQTVISTPYAPPGREFLRALHDYMTTNTKYLKGRELTRGSVTGSAGTGNAVLERLVVDWQGNPLEASQVGVITAQCVAGVPEGETIWRPRVSLSLGAAPLDLLEDGLSKTGEVKGIAGNDWIADASFGQATISGTTTVGGWTSTTTVNSTNFAIETTDYYAASSDEGSAPKSLDVKTSCTLSTKLLRKLTRDKPVIVKVKYRCKASLVGSLRINLGNGATKTLTITGGEADEWKTFSLDLDKYLWPENFDEVAGSAGSQGVYLDLVIVVTSGGPLRLDHVECGEATWWNGVPWFLTSNATGGTTPVDLLKGWLRTFTDSCAAEGENQGWLMRLLQPNPEDWGTSLPSKADDSETWPDPA
jgi:hypothetical protein